MGLRARIAKTWLRRSPATWLVAAAASCLVLTHGDHADAKLSGKTHAYRFDGGKRKQLAWWGRAHVPSSVRAVQGRVPLVIFLHGLNKALIKYRWMGGGREGDVRQIVDDMVTSKRIEPVVIAGPSSIVASQVSRGASWNNFDLDGFIDRTIAALHGHAAIDEKRIVVAGHSGAGCSLFGGLATAHKSRRKLLGLLSIDTCMASSLATRLVRKASPTTHIVVSYQTVSWTKRSFRGFAQAFAREAKAKPAKPGILRQLDHQKPRTNPHNATVKLTLERWLPTILR